MQAGTYCTQMVHMTMFVSMSFHLTGRVLAAVDVADLNGIQLVV